ncbi:MAG: hypothetical protein HXS54_00710 [Theionarchaea archaeon]|nr:hypothetical protein [Theionarchaea archaeon]
MPESHLKALWYHHAVVWLVEGIATIFAVPKPLFCKTYIFFGKIYDILKILAWEKSKNYFEISKKELMDILVVNWHPFSPSFTKDFFPGNK